MKKTWQKKRVPLSRQSEGTICFDRSSAVGLLGPGRAWCVFLEYAVAMQGGGFDPESPFVGRNKSHYGPS